MLRLLLLLLLPVLVLLVLPSPMPQAPAAAAATGAAAAASTGLLLPRNAAGLGRLHAPQERDAASNEVQEVIKVIFPLFLPSCLPCLGRLRRRWLGPRLEAPLG